MDPRSLLVSLPASRDAVFEFLSNPENLPEWSGGFYSLPTLDEGGWISVTPLGARSIALVADDSTGLIDFFHGDKPDEMHVLPLRVLSQPHGCIVSAALIPLPGLPEDCVDYEQRRLVAGLRGLGQRFGGGRLTSDDDHGRTFVPGVVTARFHETWDFYTTHFGFRTESESNCHVHLVHPNGARMTLLREEIDGLPSALTHAPDGRGFWLELPVDDVDAVYQRLVAAGVEISEPPQDRPWHERDCRLRDPNGVMIQLSHTIPAPDALESRPAAS